MDLEAVAQMCLELPGVYDDEPFGPETTVFRIRGVHGKPGKLFALMNGGADAGGATRFNLKCEPAQVEGLRASHPEIVPGYHMNKRHWNTIRLGGDAPVTLSKQQLKELIEDSYDLVVASLPKVQQERLRWVGLAAGDAATDSARDAATD